MNNDTVGTNLFRLHYKLSYQKPSFLQKPVRSLHRKTVALVMLSLVGVQKSSTQMVPAPFPDIPAEGACWALKELSGKCAMLSIAQCQHLV